MSRCCSYKERNGVAICLKAKPCALRGVSCQGDEMACELRGAKTHQEPAPRLRVLSKEAADGK